MTPSNLAPLARPNDAQEVRHFQWGLSFHETCQYNFFCTNEDVGLSPLVRGNRFQRWNSCHLAVRGNPHR